MNEQESPKFKRNKKRQPSRPQSELKELTAANLYVENSQSTSSVNFDSCDLDSHENDVELFYRKYLARSTASSSSFELSFDSFSRRRISVYVLVQLSSLVVLLVATLYSSLTSPMTCDIQLPDFSGGHRTCCECMCDLQEAREMSWCAANATVNETSETTGLQQILYKANYNSHVPDGVKRESHKDVIITSGLVVSCVLLAYQLGLGVKRGNVFTLVFVSILSMLQSLRHLLFSSAQTLSVDGFLEMVGLALSIASFPLLYRAREQLSKNRFLFFGIATRNKQLLDHYERMFAFTLMDWQVSLTFCVQCAIISQNFWIRSAIICLSVCDVFSLYLAYLYVRYERKIILVAIAAKSFALVVWIVLVAYYYHCFADYRASAMYIRSLIASSSYLMIDRLDAVRYVGGHCDLLSSISTADEAVFFLILILLAVVLRLLSCNHALMLTLHFNEGSEGGIIKSLFFDVVAAREVRRRVEAKDFDANDA